MQSIHSSNARQESTVSKNGQYRVMIVDDSAVIRGIFAKWLEEDPSIKVVSTASNGSMALKSMVREKPELIILDIEMPVMDGMTALPKIFEINPDVQVLMASTLTKRNAEISLRALSMGAADYVSKPESNREVSTSMTFQQELIGKVVSLVSSKRQQNRIPLYKGKTTLVDKQFISKRPSEKTPSIRKISRVLPEILAVGCSTGGPQALLKFLTGLNKDIKIPVLITQHMPATFTNILATHLSRATSHDCKEAEDGDLIEKGKIYIAPGDFHMTVEKKNGGLYIKLNQDAPENFCRPSVDIMFKSIVKNYGQKVLGVILTGMGHDGLEGSREIVNSGGNLIAQDEETSVVWGMPGAVSQAGLCSAVLALDDISGKVRSLISGGAA